MKGVRVSAADQDKIMSVYLSQGYHAARPLAQRLGLCPQYINNLARRLGHKNNPRLGGAHTATHGMSGTREYKIWSLIIDRCENETTPSFRKYGARGISICAAWRSDFMAFYRDMGPRPSPSHSIDRIDNSGNYEPGNCRWATKREQANNTRANRKVIYRGVEMTLTNAFRASGCTIGFPGVRYRLENGWDLERALHEPPSPRPPAKTHCPQGHALVGYNLTLTKQGYRNCRTCAVERNRIWTAQLRRENKEKVA